MSASWQNPYEENNHKASLAKLNRERVQRRRSEWEFMKTIDKQFDIKRLDEMRAKAAAEMHQDPNAAGDGHDGHDNAPPSALQTRKIRGKKVGPRTPALPPVYEFSFFLPAEAIRCLAVAHGGASLWTGENDGSISIRNGATGQIAFTINPAPPSKNAAASNLPPDCISNLYAPDEGTQMWVGTDSGVVRVYDSRIFVRLHEATHPCGPVSCFVSSFNGRTFSAAGTSIIKWGTAEQKFAVLLELSHPSKVTAMTTHGYYLFVAGENEICSYDGETGEPRKVFRGHTDTVTCLAIHTGLLLSGSSDGSVRAWEVETADPVATLILPERSEAMMDPSSAPQQSSDKNLYAIVDIITDSVTGQLWSIDRRSAIDIWAASSTGSFSFVRHIPGKIPQQQSASGSPSPSPVRQVTGAVAVDASKIWSLGSNGVNMIWHSTHNVMESQMAVAAVQMERELEEAHKEMAQWREFIRTRRVVYENLRKTVAERLAAVNEQLVLQDAYNRWFRGIELRKRAVRQAAAVEIASEGNELNVRWNFFSQWITHVRKQQQERAKAKLAEALREAAAQAELISQARQAQIEAGKKLHRRRLAQIVEGLGKSTEQQALLSAWRKWSAYRVQTTTPNNKADRAVILGDFSKKEFLRRSYLTWLSFAMRCRRSRMAENRAHAVNVASDNELRARWFAVLRANAEKKMRAKLLLKQVEALEQRNTSALLSEYYTLWYRFWARIKEARLRKEMEDSMDELKQLREKFKTIEHLHRRKKMLDHAEKLVKDAEEALEATRKAQQDTRDDIKRLQDELEAKRRGEKEERQRSITEQVDDLIAMLKAKVLNVHLDFALYTTIIKKQQASNMEQPAAKMFLEAHQAIKRLIVTWTNIMHLSADEEWPITEELVREQLKSHEVATVLDAIKTMVITFDLMTPSERSGLDTDREVQVNAKWITFLADFTMEQRAVRLGTAANRVK